MAEQYDKDLCEEVRKNLHARIDELKKELETVKRRVLQFNLIGLGILVSIITGLITNLFRG